MFKELRSLIRAKAVVKAQRTYALSLPWIWANQAQLERIEAAQLSERSLARLLPAPGEKSGWSFTNLLHLKMFWSHLVVACLAKANAETLYSWNPHAWFYLVLAEHEHHLLEGLHHRHATMFKMVGSSSAIDKSVARFWKGAQVTYSFAPGPLQNERRLYFSVINSWVISVRLPQLIAAELERFYREFTHFDESACAALIRIMQSRLRIRLEIRNDPKRARKLTKIFQEYFGSPSAR
jgi:hypothetical protein